MANPYVNKVIINGVTKIDLSNDTVAAAHLESGYTAHDKSGAQITGTLVKGIVPSGSQTKTANGTYDVTTLAQLIVAIPVYDGTVM